MSIEAMKQMVEALEINLVFLRKVKPFKGQEDLIIECGVMTEEMIAAGQQAIAEAEKQEPVMHTAVFNCPHCEYPHRVVTHITGAAQPPWKSQRQWVGLTDEEYKNLHLQMGSMYFYQDYGKAIEAKLKEKNK